MEGQDFPKLLSHLSVNSTFIRTIVQIVVRWIVLGFLLSPLIIIIISYTELRLLICYYFHFCNFFQAHVFPYTFFYVHKPVVKIAIKIAKLI